MIPTFLARASPLLFQPALALADTPVCAILPTGATSVFTAWHNRLSGNIRPDFSPQLSSSSLPHGHPARHPTRSLKRIQNTSSQAAASLNRLYR